MLRIFGWVLMAAGLLVVAVMLVLRLIVAPSIDAKMNAVIPHDAWPVSAQAQALHKDVQIADLHADMLLWERNPSKKHDYGHTDLPRLRAGGTALQVFSAVTKSPSGLNYEENDASSDDITTLAIAQGWPRRTWGSILERARYQAHRLHRVASRDERFFVIQTQQDLRKMLALRATDPMVMGGILATEGSHPLEASLENIDVLYSDGYRMMGLQHFFDNALGGSLHGLKKGGLTDFGKAAVDKMVAQGIIIDVAHSSEAVVRDILSRTDVPLVVSHTGVQGLCDSPRNIDDALMRQIAERGGLIGIGFWDEAVCDASPTGLAATIKQSIAMFGEDAIALGSDFDGTVTAYFDSSEMAALTHALLAAGVTPAQIKKVMGANQIAFFLEYLPTDPVSAE